MGKILVACAAIGALGGALVLGAVVGLTVSTVGGAAAASFCATRQNRVGVVTRKAGGVAVSGIEKAKQFNEQHGITEKLADASSQAVGKVRQVNERFGITEKVSHGVGVIASRAQEVEQRHHVGEMIATRF